MALADINITKENDSSIAKLMEKNYFNTDKEAAQFAVSFVLGRYDLSSYGKLDEYKPVSGYKNNKWHTNDFDGDRFYRSLILLYYIDIEDEDKALRSVISIGLDKLDELISNNRDWTFVNLL